MRLLIVDDQSSVLEGLLSGIDWQGLGFAEVCTASNAVQARGILAQKPVDVMLCDIEMPVENGLALFAWMRGEGYGACCIFLTSHADFEYAQRAVSLGAYDYVVQPAPYKEIAAVVQRAVAHVKKERDEREVYDMGLAFRQQSPAIVANVLRQFLQGSQNQRDIQTLAALGSFPQLDDTGYLVLLQVVSWTALGERWEGTLLAVALGNFAEEIFGPNNQLARLCYMEDNSYALVVTGRGADGVQAEALKRQLVYLNSVCEEYVHCSLACYYTGPATVQQLATGWGQLTGWRDENVTLKSGVFSATAQQGERQQHVFRVPEIRQWYKLLKEGYSQTVQQQATGLLDAMAADGRLDREALRYFYQDYMQMLYHTVEGNEETLHSLFCTPESMELYRGGMKSVEQMKALVRYTANNLHVGGQARQDPQAVVDQIKQYVAAHMDEEIRRGDVARHVHLNPDYLTRTFKKETGQTLKEYITGQKMREAQSLLRTTSLPVSFVAAKLGYSNFSHFSYTYKKVMGVSPQEERGAGAAE